MKIAVISVVVAGLVFLSSGLTLANGLAKEGAKPAEEVKPAEVVTPPAVSKAVALKSPGLACFLSVLLPGLGQVYNEDLGKALIMGGAEGLCWVMVGQDLDSIGIFGLVMGRIISPVDAYYSALNKNKGLTLEINKGNVLLAYKANF